MSAKSTTNAVSPSSPILKGLAGHIQKLSYREMKELCEIMGATETMAENLLLAADRILAKHP